MDLDIHFQLLLDKVRCVSIPSSRNAAGLPQNKAKKRSPKVNIFTRNFCNKNHAFRAGILHLRFTYPSTANFIWRKDFSFKVSSEKLEMPDIKFTRKVHLPSHHGGFTVCSLSLSLSISLSLYLSLSLSLSRVVIKHYMSIGTLSQ